MKIMLRWDIFTLLLMIVGLAWDRILHGCRWFSQVVLFQRLGPDQINKSRSFVPLLLLSAVSFRQSQIFLRGIWNYNLMFLNFVPLNFIHRFSGHQFMLNTQQYFDRLVEVFFVRHNLINFPNSLQIVIVWINHLLKNFTFRLRKFFFWNHDVHCPWEILKSSGLLFSYM
jgi:hypothetical protein